MAGITFSEGEIKRLILALAGSKSMPASEEPEEKDEEIEEEPAVKSGEGKPFGESTREMLARKLKEKGSK